MFKQKVVDPHPKPSIDLVEEIAMYDCLVINNVTALSIVQTIGLYIAHIILTCGTFSYGSILLLLISIIYFSLLLRIISKRASIFFLKEHISKPVWHFYIDCAWISAINSISFILATQLTAGYISANSRYIMGLCISYMLTHGIYKISPLL